MHKTPGFLLACLLVTTPVAAETPDAEFAKFSELMRRGQGYEARRTLDKILATPATPDSVWERAIRVSMECGQLEDAAILADRLVERTGATPPLASHQLLVEEIQALHAKELDRLLSLKAWVDVGLDEEDFASKTVESLRRLIRRDRGRCASAMKHALMLLDQSQGEINTRQAGGWAGPGSRFLARMGRVPGLMKEVLEQADARGLAANPEWTGDLLNQMQQPEMLQDPSHVRAIFEDTPLVGVAGSFRDVALPGHAWASMLGELTSMLVHENGNADLRLLVERTLRARASLTFGQDFALSLVSEYEDKTPLLEFLKRRRPDFVHLTDEAASTMLLVLSTRIYALGSPAPLPADLLERVQPLLEAETWHLDGVRLTWQNAKQFEDLRLGPKAAMGVAVMTMRRLAVRNPAQAEALLGHAVRLFRDSVNPEVASMVPALLAEVAETPEMLKPVLQLSAREGLWQQRDWLSKTLTRAWRPGDHVEQPGRLMVFLESAGLLGDVGQFSEGWQADEAHASAGFVRRFQSTVMARSNVAGVLIPLLSERAPRAFGPEMLLAVLQPQERVGVTVLEVAKKRRDEIAALPADRLTEMARFLATWVPDLDAVAVAVPGLAAVLDDERRGQKEQAMQQVAKIQGSRNLGELFKDAKNEYQMLRMNRTPAPLARWAATLALACSVDGKLAGEAFRKFSLLLRDESRLNMAPTGGDLLANWYMEAAAHSVLLPLVKETSSTLPPVRDPFWPTRLTDALFPLSSFRDADGALQVMEREGLLEEVATLPLNPWGRMRGPVSVIASRLRVMSPEVRKALSSRLAGRKPVTTGSVLMRALCEDGPEGAALILSERQEELAGLPTASGQGVLQALHIVYGGSTVAAEVARGEGVLARLTAAEVDVERAYLEALSKGQSTPPLPPVRGSNALVADALVDRLVQGDRDGANRLFERYFESRSRSTPGPDFRAALFHGPVESASSLMKSLLHARGHPTIVGFLVNRMNASETLVYGVPGVDRAKMLATVLAEDWVAEAGWAAPALAARKVLEEFRQGLGAMPPAVAGTVLTQFLKELPGPCQEEVLAWATGLRGDDPLHPLADELLHSSRSLQEDKAASYWQRQLALLDLGKSPGAGRAAVLGTVIYGLNETPGKVPSALVLRGAELAVQSWVEEGEVLQPERVMVLEAFANLPDSPEWREVAGKFAAAWDERNAPFAKSSTRLIDPTALHAALGIAARLGDEARLDALFENHRSTLRTGLWPVAVLARHGKTERAATLIREGWRERAGEDPYLRLSRRPRVPPGSADLSRPLAEALRATSGEMALLGEYAMLQDTRPWGRPATSGDMVEWRKQLEDFLEGLAALDAGDPAMRVALLALVGRENPDMLPDLRPGTAAAMHRARLELDASRDERSRMLAVEVLAMGVAARALNGEKDVITTNLELLGRSLRKIDPDASWEMNRAYGEFLVQVAEGLAASFDKLDAPRRKALLDELGTCLAAAGNPSALSGTRLSVLSWVMECWRLAHGSSEAGGWSAKGRISRLSGSTLERARHLLRQFSVGLPLEIRARLQHAALTSPEMQSELSRPDQRLYEISREGDLLTPVEFVSSGKSLCQLLKRGGRTGHELALLAFDLGRETEALALLEAAEAEPVEAKGADVRGTISRPAQLAITSPPSVGWLRETVLLGKAAFLLRRGQGEAAAKVLAAVAPGVLAEERGALLRLVETGVLKP